MNSNRLKIRLEQQFQVPIERVFQAWRDPRDLERWAWGSLGNYCHAEVDFRVGGQFTISTARPDGESWSFSGTYTEIQTNRRISHTLTWNAPVGYNDSQETVTVEFTERNGETVVVFQHAGSFSSASRDEHARGWRNVLETLKQYLEYEQSHPKTACG